MTRAAGTSHSLEEEATETSGQETQTLFKMKKDLSLWKKNVKASANMPQGGRILGGGGEAEVGGRN